MSKEDEFIHSSFFTDPWHIAIVVDPIYHNWGCFKWNDGTIARCGGFYIYAEKKLAKHVKDFARNLNTSRQSTPRSASAGADRLDRTVRRPASSLWLIIGLLIIFQIITAFLAVRAKDASSRQPDYYSAAKELLSVSDVSGAAQYLRAELLAHPDDADAFRELGRLNEVISDPAPGASDNIRLDQINFTLITADEIATKTGWEKTSLLDQLPGTGDKNPDAAAAAKADPVRQAFDAYNSPYVAATYQARLERAILIRNKLSKGSAAVSTRRWFDESVKWLQEEDLRKIAYGSNSGDRGSTDAYRQLSKDQKTVVDKVRKTLGTRQ